MHAYAHPEPTECKCSDRISISPPGAGRVFCRRGLRPPTGSDRIDSDRTGSGDGAPLQRTGPGRRIGPGRDARSTPGKHFSSMAMGCGNLGWLQGSGKRFDAVDSSLTHLIPTAAPASYWPIRPGGDRTTHRSGRGRRRAGTRPDPHRSGRGPRPRRPIRPGVGRVAARGQGRVSGGSRPRPDSGSGEKIN